MPGIKLEQFIFDAFVHAERVALFEVDRAAEFAPVKNAAGPGSRDSPDTARAALLRLHASWVRAAGGVVQEGPGVEVAASASYAGEGLDALCRGNTFQAGDVVA